MPLRNEKSEVINAILSVAAVGGLTAAMLVAPNSMKLLEKPLRKFLRNKDKNEREREIRKLLIYMHRQGLVKAQYEHGLQITDKAKIRLQRLSLDTLHIQIPKEWDKKWRITFYDIPEKQKYARDALAFRLRKLGCQQLQKSVWVHPHNYEKEVMALAASYGIGQYITYLETDHINNQRALIQRFKHLSIK